MKKIRLTICLVVAVLFMTAGQGFGFIDFKDGGTHNISSTINDDVYVDNVAPGMKTTVNLLNGGGIFVPYILYGFNDSRINISGGEVDKLYSYDYSTVNISDGRVGSLNSPLYSYDYSTVNIFGGGVDSLRSDEYSTVNISDGTVSGLYHYGHSTANITGGFINDILIAEDYSTVNISDGFVDWLWADDYSIVDISGGDIENLHTHSSSITTFYGQNFLYGSGLTLDGNRVLGTGILSGEWQNGTPWTVNIAENQSTAIILVVPEPAMLLLLGIGAVMLRKRRS